MELTINKLPDEALPDIDDLGGDMRIVAERIGIRAALELAESFGGTPIQLYGHRKWLIKHRDNLIRSEYDRGGISGVELARKFGITDRHLWNILGRAPVDDRQLKLF